MRIPTFCLSLALASIQPAFAYTPMPRPTSLPDITLDCYQSFYTKTYFPESRLDDGQFPIDGDNFDKPIPRYRLQAIDGAVLKVIKEPTRAALRQETGVQVTNMMRDFSNRHAIVGWREKDSFGGSIQYTLNFDDLLFSKTEVTSAKANPASAGVILTVMKCRKV